MSSVRFLSLTGAATTLIALTSCGNPQTSTPITSEANQQLAKLRRHPLK